MGALSLVSVGLFLLPIAVTIGTLLGVEGVRRNNGEQSVFAPPPNDKITTSQFCQLGFGFTPLPDRYTYNPNQWGVTSGNGNLCMNVTWYENGTYPTNATAPPFTATWQYPQAPQDQPVHAFPNALVNFTDAVQASTIQIGNLSAMNVDVMWTYGTGPDVATQLDPVALDAAELNANVCIDTFLDSDPIKAQTTNSSQYEVMVWFGQFGLATDPIGFVQGVVETVTVNTTQFALYYGQNSNTLQKVFTWMAVGNATDFDGDISPLFTKLADHAGPVAADHLGYAAFGSEALYATEQVTFSVTELSIGIGTGGAAAPS